MTEENIKQTPKRRRIIKIVAWVIVVLIITVGIAGYILLAVSPVPNTSNYEIDLSTIRKLAREGDGTLPIRLNAMIVAEGAYPQIMVVAGGSFQENLMPIPVFQVVYEDGSIIVDTALTAADQAQMFPGTPYYAARYNLMQNAMRHSKLVLVTHEHFDHINGLTQSPYLEEVTQKTVLTGEQIDNAIADTGLTAEIIAKVTRLDYDTYHQIAPGMVLIKAAGHTPGSQMVYVQLQNGREYLLVGDVIWTSENLTRLTGRPLLTNLFLGEDPRGHREQVRTLYNISQNEDIILVISHDGPQLDSYMKQGLLGDGFEF